MALHRSLRVWILWISLYMVVAPAESIRFPVEVHSLEYPRLALLSGIAGSVEVRCQVDAEGTVKAVEPVSGPKLLAEHAKENAFTWRFNRDGKDDRSTTVVTLVFEFVISGISPNATPKSSFVFRYPNLVQVTSTRPRVAANSPIKH